LGLVTNKTEKKIPRAKQEPRSAHARAVNNFLNSYFTENKIITRILLYDPQLTKKEFRQHSVDVLLTNSQIVYESVSYEGSQPVCLSVCQSVCLSVSVCNSANDFICKYIQLPVFSQSISHSFTLLALYICLTNYPRHSLLLFSFPEKYTWSVCQIL